MTMSRLAWRPELEGRPGPRYRGIAEALEADIEAGRLRPGDRLPTHRSLARRLGIALGTVTRAYAEAERRGLITGEVGRGTFVRTRVSTTERLGGSVGPSVVDLGLLSSPADAEERRAVRRLLAELARDPSLAAALEYPPPGGALPHRAGGARWLAAAGLDRAPEDVLVCASAQHAALVALSVLLRPGDALLIEELTDPAVLDLARWMPLRLHGLPLDAQGVIPEAFEAACRSVARTFLCQPTLQNPTTATMPVERRRLIAEIARRHEVAIVENGVLALLAADAPPPLSALAPERSYYLTSVSKLLAPGIRVGYLSGPPPARAALEGAIRATVWTASPLLAEIAARWVGDERLPERLKARRDEAQSRQEIAARVLPAGRSQTDPRAVHLWLHLPEARSGGEFAASARDRGVIVTPPEAFVAGRRPPPAAVRVCLSAARERSSLEAGLRTLAALLAEGG